MAVRRDELHELEIYVRRDVESVDWQPVPIRWSSARLPASRRPTAP